MSRRTVAAVLVVLAALAVVMGTLSPVQPGALDGSQPRLLDPPSVTITSYQDPVHDGAFTYRLKGRVRGLAPDAIDRVTVFVNGKSLAITLDESDREAVTGTFDVNLSIDQQTAAIRVQVTAAADVAVSPRQDEALLRLDGDGLSDDYEAATTTNPLDPDSNAAVTGWDESDDGVVDGEEDFDVDGLTSIREQALGTNPVSNDTDRDGLSDSRELEHDTDPRDADTDGDRLPDGFEVDETDTDPLDVDTNDDGTPDGAADPDSDGRSNWLEYRYKTDPTTPDTDGDGTPDGREPTTTPSSDERDSTNIPSTD